MQENYELVQKGFRVLHPLMAGYIGLELNRSYHDGWWDEVLSVLSDQRDLPYTGTYETLIDSLDIANCIRIIDRKWNEVFRDELDINCRTWAKELMGVRNTVAHIGQQDMSQADAERALDTMVRLCRSFDSDGADEIEELYLQVRNQGESNSVYGGNGPAPIDVPSSETIKVDLGSLNHQNLIELIGTDVVQKTTLTRKVTFAGKTQAYPVYKVRLDLLYYNDQNDRIATWITRYKAENGSDALRKLTKEDYNDVIENFIYDSNPESIVKTQNNIKLVGQREPGVALADGRIVDGNRRYTCLRRIQRDSQEPIYFETVIMDVDIQTDKKQIKMLELAIQHGEEKKVDYDLIDYAIGTYMDVERTKLLSLEEYAESTNETVGDVKKRIEIAKVICEFLEYVRLPEQFHVAREYQVYSLFQEMMPQLNKLEASQKKQLKVIVYNNVLMKALLDQRKFIREIKMLISKDTYDLYFEDQKAIDEQIHKLFDETDIKSKSDIDKFARDNESIAEELQLSLEKALLRSRRQQLKAKPAENVAKSFALLSDLDARMFDKLSTSEKVALKSNMDQLTAVAESYSKALSGEQSAFDSYGRIIRNAPEIIEQEIKTPNEPMDSDANLLVLAKSHVEEPVLICKDALKTITTLSFSLSFKAIKENEKQENQCSVELYFIDSSNSIVSNTCKAKIDVGNVETMNFVLNGSVSESKETYLVVRSTKDKNNEVQRIIPFTVDIAFSADFDF